MAADGQGAARQIRNRSGKLITVNFSDALMMLVGAGHSLDSILNQKWQGCEYNGWPLLVFLHQLRAVMRFNARERLNSLDDIVVTNNMGVKEQVAKEHREDLKGTAHG